MVSRFPKSADGLMVRVSRDVSAAGVRNIVKSSGSKSLKFSVEDISGDGLYYVETKSRLNLPRAWALAREINSHDLVYYAEVDVEIPGIDGIVTAPTRNRKFSGSSDPHKPGSDDPEWSLENAGVIAAWKLKPKGKKYGSGIRVGHTDTGYRRHPEIDTARLLPNLGYDYKDDKEDPVDPLKKGHVGHGTATASIIFSGIGSPSGSEEFVSGTGPKAQLVPIRVSHSVIHIRWGKLIRGIYKAVESNCHIISMSLGGRWGSQALSDAVLHAQDNGVIILGAAGNKVKKVVYPAKIPSVIAVAASNCDDKPWKDSSRGPEVDISAPGESVWRARTDKNANYDVKRSNGTSYAVATTAGICALWLSHHGRQALISKYGKSRLSSVFQSITRSSGVRRIPGWDTGNYGAGIIDAAAMLKAALPTIAPVRRFSVGDKVAPNLNTIEELADYFPSASTGRLTEVLQKTFGAKQDGLFDVISKYGDEIRFHCATNEDFRRSLMDLASPKRKSIRGFRGSTAARNDQLGSQASKDLLNRMNVR